MRVSINSKISIFFASNLKFANFDNCVVKWFGSLKPARQFFWNWRASSSVVSNRKLPHCSMITLASRSQESDYSPVCFPSCERFSQRCGWWRCNGMNSCQPALRKMSLIMHEDLGGKRRKPTAQSDGMVIESRVYRYRYTAAEGLTFIEREVRWGQDWENPQMDAIMPAFKRQGSHANGYLWILSTLSLRTYLFADVKYDLNVQTD